MARRINGRPRSVFGLGVAAAVLAAVSGCGGSVSAPKAAAPHSATAPGSSAATTPPPAATPSAVTSAKSAVVYGCDQKPVASPADFTLACGDGEVGLKDLVWSDWGRPTAVAKGKYLAVSCVPSCAQGTEVPYPAKVTVSGLSHGSYTVLHISAPRAPSPAPAYRLDAQGPVETH